MKRFPILLVPILIVALLLVPSFSVQADTGPHPTMEFQLVWLIPRVSVMDAALYNCEDSICEDPVKVGGPFSCSNEGCWYNYGSEGFYKLVIEFDDQTRESNVFEKRGFSAVFVTDVNAADLLVEQTNFPVPYAFSTQFLGFVFSLPITWFIEIAVGVFLLRRWNYPRRWGLILVLNLITLPFVWFIFPLMNVETLYALGMGELFAFLFESISYFLAMKKEGMTIGQAFLLGLWTNLASIILPVACIWLYFVAMS